MTEGTSWPAARTLSGELLGQALSSVKCRVGMGAPCVGAEILPFVLIFAFTSSSIPAILASAAISPRLTASHPNSAVKRGRVEAVLRWGTTREGSMLYFFLCSLSPLLLSFASTEVVPPTYLPTTSSPLLSSIPCPPATRTPFTLSTLCKP